MRNQAFSRSLTCAAAVLAILLCPSLVLAADSDTGDVSVEIQNQAITLTNQTALSFGTVLPFGRNGTVTINAATGASSASNVHVAVEGSNANWSVTGVPGAFYSITLPDNGAVSVTAGAEAMSVTGFTDSLSPSQQRLDATGNGSFGVGATLQVSANQASGTYTGTYLVTVAYN